VALKDLVIASGYSTGAADLIADFYVPCLGEATKYDRAAGYFRSSLYILIGTALSSFALRGGRVRLVCSPHLTPDDIAAMERGEHLREKLDDLLERELQQVLKEPANRPVIELLSTLIALGNLDIKVAIRPGSAGIFHDKLGLFADDSGHEVSFVGSSNETWNAWDTSGNHEVLEVFRSWGTSDEGARLQRHRAYFDRLWDGDDPGVEVYHLPDAMRERLLTYADPEGITAAVTSVRAAAAGGSRPISPRQLQPHQQAVVAAWRAHNRGLVAHATGAGKTIAALEIVRGWLEQGAPVLILVPSELLLHQWLRELRQELADIRPAILQAGAGAGRETWRNDLPDFTRNQLDLGPRVTVATMQTAASALFISQVQQGQHLLLVADEVHRLGAPILRRCLTIQAGGRLGLSATPERFGDVAGTAAIFDYFGEVLEPRFGLADAIQAGRLVPYDYHCHLVALSTTEAEAWLQLTDEIGRLYARLRDQDDPFNDERLRMLLIRRARIIKKASAKTALAAATVASNFEPGQRWLVYCDDTEQLESVMRGLRSAGFDPLEYHSAMEGSRNETLSFFRRAGGVLVAIRCLDEGVDIPEITHALILASSANSREHVQRRGRVLRTAVGKYSAVVHDVLVALAQPSPAPYLVIDGDLRRAIAFAADARNAGVREELDLLQRQSTASVVSEIEMEEQGDDARD
jgi:superfamily II DNA or RNA helicase